MIHTQSMMAMKMKKKWSVRLNGIGAKIVMVPNPWGRGVEESYDFDVTKSDKLFDFLLEKGRSSCPMVMLCCPLIS